MKKLLNLVILTILFVASHSMVKGQMKVVNLVAKMSGVFLDESFNQMPYWGYGIFEPGGPYKSEFPAPLLEFNQDDSVTLHFFNDSPEDHTIHLHGLDVDQLNDGVGHTSVDIMPGGYYDYKFKATHPGSFLYHCHVNSTFHLALGMYGMITVNASDSLYLYNGGPGYNKKYQFLASDMYTYWNLNMTSPGPFHLYDPDYFMINGKSGNQLFDNNSTIIEAEAGDSVLLRLANISYTMVEYIFPSGSNVTAYMSDGRTIPTPFQTDTLRLFAGERFSVVMKPTQYIEDYITVNHYNMYGFAFEGQNFIGINQFAAPVSVIENEEQTISLFPNPASNHFYIKNTDYLIREIMILDIMGRAVTPPIQITQETIEIPCYDLKKGIYIVQITKEDGSVACKKIIVQP
jgi:FtsP/CotA-like multicopper oxidase with cupredoxin domain